MERFDGKVAVVTGASRGIGRSIAERLASLGASVIVNYAARAASADEVVTGIQEHGGKAVAFQGDVRQAADAEALVAHAVRTFGGLHILVNNAGITRDQLILRTAEEDWDAVLDTNLKGAFLCTKAALRPMMRQRWGRIVNITSVAWMIGNPGQANYTAAKAGMVALTRTTAVEMASRGITANAVAPGYIATELTGHLAETRTAEALKRIPVGRPGTGDDIAAVVAFFASEAAEYITGQVLNVDGGMCVALT